MAYVAFHNNTVQKREEKRFLLIAAMLSAFCILKVLRGSDMDSDSVGGIWNYISLLYYPVFLLAVIRQRVFQIKTLFVSALLYISLAVLATAANTDIKLSSSFLYYFLMIPYSVLVFYVFYLCSRDSEKGEKILLVGYMACLVLTLLFSVRFRFQGGSAAMKSDIYFSCGLFPFALQLIERKPVRRIVFLLQFLAVFLSDKRTALISFVIGMVLYWLVEGWRTSQERFVQTMKTVAITAVLGLALYSVSKYIDDTYQIGIYERLFRIQEDGGSGRTTVYLRVWEYYKESSFSEKLFGHGMNSVGAIAGVGHAHNDILEVLYNYGIFAAVSLIVFYLSIIRESIRLIRRKSPYSAAFLFATVIGLFLGMFSYFMIYYTYVTCIVAFWGYALAMEKKRLQRTREEA